MSDVEDPCHPAEVNEIAGYWRCGHCGDECPATCPIDAERGKSDA